MEHMNRERREMIMSDRYEVKTNCIYDESLLIDKQTGELLNIIDCYHRLNKYEKLVEDIYTKMEELDKEKRILRQELQKKEEYNPLTQIRTMM